MEPVMLPRAVAPVVSSDRVKRSKPREDSRGGSAFARYLRQPNDKSEDAPATSAKDSDETADPEFSEEPAEPDGHPAKKLIDIRV